MSTRPSHLLGLRPDTYESYCLDEAVIYFGMTLTNMLESAGHKPSKEERAAIAARERILDAVLSEGDEVQPQKTGYADPASMFS